MVRKVHKNFKKIPETDQIYLAFHSKSIKTVKIVDKDSLRLAKPFEIEKDHLFNFPKTIPDLLSYQEETEAS